jgi:hypothetical protein
VTHGIEDRYIRHPSTPIVRRLARDGGLPTSIVFTMS